MQHPKEPGKPISLMEADWWGRWGRVLAAPLSLSSRHIMWPHASLDPQWTALGPAPLQPPWLQLSTVVLSEEHHVSPSNSATQKPDPSLLGISHFLPSFPTYPFWPKKENLFSTLQKVNTSASFYTFPLGRHPSQKEYLSPALLSIWAPLLLQIPTQTHFLWEQLVKFS